jgi:hypothetical protein
MSFAFIQDVPANEEIHQQIRAQLGDAAPDGLVAHIVYRAEGCLRFVDVWETEESWRAFHDEALRPAVESVLGSFGMVPDDASVVREQLELVDVWVPTASPVAAG